MFRKIAFLFLLAATASAASPAEEKRKLGLVADFIPAGKYARKGNGKLKPAYITIHATDNRSRGANARMHAQALKTGALKGSHNRLGYVSWHFTVDDRSIYQHLPTNERGEHADYDGTGNRSSIGIEMCMNRDGNLAKTLDRSARFAAVLMKEHGIGIERVVPHYHWNRVRHDDGKKLGHKACPSILMDGGRPGKKWAAFLAKIAAYRKSL